jgi:hypothetical protein
MISAMQHFLDIQSIDNPALQVRIWPRLCKTWADVNETDSAGLESVSHQYECQMRRRIEVGAPNIARNSRPFLLPGADEIIDIGRTRTGHVAISPRNSSFMRRSFDCMDGTKAAQRMSGERGTGAEACAQCGPCCKQKVFPLRHLPVGLRLSQQGFDGGHMLCCLLLQ